MRFTPFPAVCVLIKIIDAKSSLHFYRVDVKGLDLLFLFRFHINKSEMHYGPNNPYESIRPKNQMKH